MRACVLGISVWGPGLRGWQASRPVLAGLADHEPCEAAPPPPSMLSATERRRTSLAVRLALHAAQEACAMSGLEPGTLRAVFGTSNGDGAVMHAILESIATGEGHVSPTQFHNSVHNAAAGYWTIGTGSRQPATCIGCHDTTAGMALLSAAAEIQVEQVPVLLCVYDLPLPEPLHAKRPVQHGFAAALVLAPASDAVLADIEVVFSPTSPATVAADRESSLSALARVNPAARMLPLLQALAVAEPATVQMPLVEGRLDIAVTPCSTAGKSPP